MTRFDDEIRSDFHTIKNIVLEITLLIDDVKYFKTLTDSEKEVFKDYRFLWRTYNSLYVKLILDFNKLFDENESYSFSTLINKLKNNQRRIQWHSKPDKILYDTLKQKLDNLIELEIVTNIKIARDKFYAHLDYNRPPNLKIDIKGLEELLNISQEFINCIYEPLDGTHQAFGFSSTDIGHELITDLDKFNKIRRLIYREMENDKDKAYLKMRKILDNKNASD